MSAEYTKEDGQTRKLRGATRDPEVVGLVRRFACGEMGDLLAA